MTQLAYFRKLRNLSQAELAEACGVDRSNISRWENGEYMPHVKKLPIIAKTLGCTIDELLQEPKETTNN